MGRGPEESPLEDLQNFLQDFKDKYTCEVEVDTDFVQSAGKDNPEDNTEWTFDFDYTPAEIKEHLDEYVIGQNGAKKHLANAVCYHYHHIDRDDPHYQKKNILMIGNTGVGKTHLVEVLSEYIGVPFVKADATKFSGTGYVGKNVNSLVRELVDRADDNLSKAEHG
ncbi:MAG: AAA family ATPase, partial [bacterium]